MNWKKIIALVLVLVGILLIGASAYLLWQEAEIAWVNPLSSNQPQLKEYPLKKYAFTTLKNQPANPSEIKVDQVLTEGDEYMAYQFWFTTEGKKMTGQLHIPKEATPAAGFPVVVMLRGFVDPSIYETGVGTKNAAAVLATNGFVTVAPDFFGYGGSDMEDVDVMKARLEKPKNIVDLLASLTTLQFVNDTRVGLWGHSNGGQLALSVLEITGKKIPTTLWAPVSTSFPYSILYYSDEAEDQGKALRKLVSDFEQNYDVNDYSIDRYWDWIQAPILLHHGSLDEAAPIRWSESLNETLRTLDKEIEFMSYNGADHNLRPVWNEVVGRDVAYFQEKLQ